MSKPLCERISDFVDRWSSEQSGGFEFFLNDGRRVLIYDCYLTRDMAGRPDFITVNSDTPGQFRVEFDVAEVEGVYDIGRNCAIIEK
jgi:hypothetical protein